MKTLNTQKEVLAVLKSKGITVNFGHSNFAYKQSGINTAQAIENKLQYGWISIIWSNVPKIHIKTVKELVRDLESYEVEEITVDGRSITPAHTLYLK